MQCRHFHICPDLHPSFSLSLSVCTFAYLSKYPFIHPPIHPSVRPSISTTNQVFNQRTDYLTISLDSQIYIQSVFVYIYIYMYIYIHIYTYIYVYTHIISSITHVIAFRIHQTHSKGLLKTLHPPDVINSLLAVVSHYQPLFTMIFLCHAYKHFMNIPMKSPSFSDYHYQSFTIHKLFPQYS